MATSVFIKSFVVRSLPNVRPISVSLGETKTHLIITGKNGSGKTSILKGIMQELALLKATGGSIDKFREQKKKSEKVYAENPSTDNLVQLNFYKRHEDAQIALELSGVLDFIGEAGTCIFFSANRSLDANVPSSITAPTLPSLASSDGSASAFSSLIVQHLVNLKAQRAFAGDDGDSYSVKTIDEWFNSFLSALRDLFENQDLDLEFDRQSLNFLIVEGERKYSFNNLSSGQSAILSIYAELLLRVDAALRSSKDISGIILIDEPENHLHASLQKKILVFLVKAFPQFQFIVTTHSPFILTSLQDTKILNLEDGKVYDDFSLFSYEAILEEYMQVDKYSFDVKNEVESIKKLLNFGELNKARYTLDQLMNKLSKSEFSAETSAELVLELNSIKLALRNVE